MGYGVRCITMEERGARRRTTKKRGKGSCRVLHRAEGVTPLPLPIVCRSGLHCTLRFARGGRLLAFIRDPPPVEVGRRPPGGGGGGGGSKRGDGGGAAVGRVGWGAGGGWGGGSRWGHLGWGAQAPLTSPCPQSNHTITIMLTFAASWFGHASHVIWAAQDPKNFLHGCFCHMIALHFGPQNSL